MSNHAETKPLIFCTEAALTCDQVSEAMNSNGLAPPHIPQALLHALLQAPALLAALRSMIAGAGATKSTSEALSLPWPYPAPPLPTRLLLLLVEFLILQQMAIIAS